MGHDSVQREDNYTVSTGWQGTANPWFRFPASTHRARTKVGCPVRCFLPNPCRLPGLVPVSCFRQRHLAQVHPAAQAARQSSAQVVNTKAKQNHELDSRKRQEQLLEGNFRPTACKCLSFQPRLPHPTRQSAPGSQCISRPNMEAHNLRAELQLSHQTSGSPATRSPGLLGAAPPSGRHLTTVYSTCTVTYVPEYEDSSMGGKEQAGQQHLTANAS